MGVRGLLHRNPQFLYLHHSSDGTVKAQNSMQLPSADCATNCANGHVSRHSLWEVALSIFGPPTCWIALSTPCRQGRANLVCPPYSWDRQACVLMIKLKVSI